MYTILQMSLRTIDSPADLVLYTLSILCLYSVFTLSHTFSIHSPYSVYSLSAHTLPLTLPLRALVRHQFHFRLSVCTVASICFFLFSQARHRFFVGPLAAKPLGHQPQFLRRSCGPRFLPFLLWEPV